MMIADFRKIQGNYFITVSLSQLPPHLGRVFSIRVCNVDYFLDKGELLCDEFEKERPRAKILTSAKINIPKATRSLTLIDRGTRIWVRIKPLEGDVPGVAPEPKPYFAFFKKLQYDTVRLFFTISREKIMLMNRLWGLPEDNMLYNVIIMRPEDYSIIYRDTKRLAKANVNVVKVSIPPRFGSRGMLVHTLLYPA